MRILLILMLSLGLSAQAEVYKRTNPDGSVEFSDVPQSQDETPIKLSPFTTIQAPPSVLFRTTRSRPTSTRDQYTALSIISPANDTSIRDNAGNISLNTSLSPSLSAGHTLVLLMDGKPISRGKSAQFTLSNIPRGTHRFQAQVVNGEGKVLLKSSTVTIHLQRFSILHK